MDRRELLERYEIRGDEADFDRAKPLYEDALGEGPSAELHLEYGYLLECHARRELRQAAAHYERAIELDPAWDKAHYQLIQALAALFDAHEPIERYERAVEAAPDDVRGYRFLAAALAAAGRHERARAAIDAGLELSPDDAALISMRGEAKAATGDVAGALADWRRALELDTGDISPLFGSAFLLEREGRLDEAIETWVSIVAWNEERGYALSAEFPQSELRRLRRRIAGE
jgi:tetratricopeptide (TPR) repeat protein